MQAHLDTNQRLKELIAKVEIEQNPKTFSALVEELSRLLDSDRSAKKPHCLDSSKRIPDATPVQTHADIGTPWA